MTKAKQARRGAKASNGMWFKGELAPRHWLLTGTALKIGLFATLGAVVAPSAAMASCPDGSTIYCSGSGGGVAKSGTALNGKTVIVKSDGTVTSGIVMNNSGNTGNYTVELKGRWGYADPAEVKGGTNAGIAVNTKGSGKITVTTAEDTLVESGTGGVDGIRLRTVDGSITLNLDGTITAKGDDDSEAIDAQSTSGGKVTANLYGRIKGNKSQAVVLGSQDGTVEVNAYSDVKITNYGNETKDHGLWVVKSDYADIFFNGEISSVSGSGLVVGYDSRFGSGNSNADDVDIVLGSRAYIKASVDGIYVNSTSSDGDVSIENAGHVQGLTGNGATIITRGDIELTNSSPHSVIGEKDGINATGKTFSIDNGSGFVQGETESGLDIHDISGKSGVSVLIDNNASRDDEEGGAIVGHTNGVLIDNVQNGDVLILNYGYEQGWNDYEGGRIVGATADGIHITDVDNGSVKIKNQNTAENRVNGYYAGIYGEKDGIDISDVDDEVTIENEDGVIVGDDENGIRVKGADGFSLSNDGGRVEGGQDGVNLENIAGDIDIDNGEGLISGDDDGISIKNASDGDVTIETDEDGLIKGKHGDGIFIDGANDNVFIDNRYTRDDYPGGIWGGEDGIDISDVDDRVSIDNESGRIIGDGGHGIVVDDVEGTFQWIDNHKTLVGFTLKNGTAKNGEKAGYIEGDDDGINLNDIDGLVDIDNADGWVVGDDDGIRIHDVQYGDVRIDSDEGGLIKGKDGDGIEIDQVSGNVDIDNSSTRDEWPGGVDGDEDGIDISHVGGKVVIDNETGRIIGHDENGIKVANVDGANGWLHGDWTRIGFQLENGTDYRDNRAGLITGKEDGVNLQGIKGTIDIHNEDGEISGGDDGIYIKDVKYGDVLIDSHEGGLIEGERGDGIYIEDVKGKVDIDNHGNIIAADRAIRVEDAWGVTITNDGAIIGDGDDSEPVISLRDISSYGWWPSAKITNEYNGVIASRDLPDYDSDIELLDNYVLHGASALEDEDPLEALEDYNRAASDLIVKSSGGGATTVINDGLLVGNLSLSGSNGWNGNTIYNSGLWITGGTTSLHGTWNDDVIVNGSKGFIQTAQTDRWEEDVTFVSDLFKNKGVVSLVDGGTGDTVTIDADQFISDKGGFAIDVNFADEDSDVLNISGFDELSTNSGVIVRVVELGGVAGSRIEFAKIDGEAPPDAFFLDVASDHYSLDEGGTIADGLLRWYIDQDVNGDFDLVAGWTPEVAKAPDVVTAAQTTFQTGLGIVEDHIYGGQYGGVGGSGAEIEEGDGSADGTTSAAWFRVSGDYTERTTTVTTTLPNSTAVLNSQTVVGSAIAGVDFTPEGGDMRYGVYGGYTAAHAMFGTGATDATYGGLSGGAYAAYNNGEAYADITTKLDVLGVTYNFVGTSAEAIAVNLGAGANAGYRIRSEDGLFVEPIGSLRVMGTMVTDAGNTSFGDSLSVRAGAGARVGQEGVTEDLKTEVSLLARVWNEFGGPNTATVTDGGSSITTIDEIAGLYGEVSASASFQGLDSGLSTFVTAGTTFGGGSVNYSAKGGLRVGF